MIVLLSMLAFGAGPETGSPALDVGVWSTTAVEGRPALSSGDPRFRIAERMGLRAELPQGWTLGAVGGLRLRSQPYEASPTGDLWRAALEHRGEGHHLQLGRFVRSDARGLLRIDGAGGRVDVSPGVTLSGWGGRRWHPDSAQVRTAWIGGGELRVFRGTGRYGPAVAGGAEARAEEGALRSRVWGVIETAGIRGDRARLLVEAGSKGRQRVAATANLVAGSTLDVGGEVRWEGLPPATALDDVRSPMEWLSPDGYGVASARVSWRSGELTAVASGGPTVRPGEAWLGGGQGRGAVGWSLDDRTAISAFVAGYGISHSHVLGGGGSVERREAAWDARADAAAWRLVPLDGDAALITELRLLGQVDLFDLEEGAARRRLALGGTFSVGTDRQLAPFVRGGLQLTARLDGRP